MKCMLRIIFFLCIVACLGVLLSCCNTYRPVPVEQTIPYGCGIDENGELFGYIPTESEVVELWA